MVSKAWSFASAVYTNVVAALRDKPIAAQGLFTGTLLASHDPVVVSAGIMGFGLALYADGKKLRSN